MFNAIGISPAIAGGGSPLAGYALALDFKNGEYWKAGTRYATLGALPGYAFTDSVDNLPNLSAAGYTSLTAEASNLTATVNPINGDVDFIWWAIVNAGVASAAYEVYAGMSPGHYLARRPSGSDGSLTYGNGLVADFEPGGPLGNGAGRHVVLGRRRGSKDTCAVKVGGVVTVGVETGVNAFGAPTTTFYMGRFSGGNLQPNYPIEAIYLRTGTFADAEINATLQAA